MTLKLVIFDVDGTLVDSQAHIVGGMASAFAALERPLPERDAILATVGLSLPVAMARLAPEAPPGDIDALVDAYRASFAVPEGVSRAMPPLYPGAAAALVRLNARKGVLLGVATGKSRRGLDHVLAEHGLAQHFVSLQTADLHPSKPHPSMVLSVLAETGVDAAAAVMVGDTTFDLHMAQAAGVAGIGVSWGYHPVDELRSAGAARTIDSFDALDPALDELWLEAA